MFIKFGIEILISFQEISKKVENSGSIAIEKIAPPVPDSGVLQEGLWRW